MNISSSRRIPVFRHNPVRLRWPIVILIALLLHILPVHGQLPTFSWVNGGGDYGNNVQNFVHAVDSAENVYVAGTFSNPLMDLDTSAGVYTLPHVGYGDLFLAKYNPQGGLLWAFSIGSNNTADDIPYSIEVSPSGDVYITGLVYWGADFDPGPGTLLQQNGTFGFIAKYSTQGSLIWCNPMNIYPRDMVVDHAGDLAVTGCFNNTVDFDPSSGVNSYTSVFGEDLFLAKYSPSGTLLWAFSIVSTYPSSCVGAMAFSLANDSLNNLVVQGKFKASSDFDPGAGTYMLTAPTNTALSHFLAKYSAGGNFIWAFQLDLDIHRCAIAIDTSDNIVMGMCFGGTDDIDQGPAVYNFTASDLGDIGLIKYSPTGALIWAQLIPGSGFEHVTGISINANSEILITGENFNSVDFDPGPGQWMVAPTAYLVKYSPQASLIWAFSSAGAGSGDHAIEMPSGSIHWVGAMSWSADFDPTANVYMFTPGYLSGVGFFVAKYFPPGLSSGDVLYMSQAVSCYPNPAHHTLTISCSTQLNSVEITNVHGALVYASKCNTKELLIDVSTFSTGLYFVSATTETGISCSPLLVEHQ